MTSNESGSSTSSSSKQLPKLEIKDKLRVLCLHGYRQNADSFKSKLGSFRKQVSKYAEFVFVTAPHLAAPLEGGEQVDDQRSWWFNKEDRTFKGTNVEGPAFGFEESLRLVEDTWKKEGPFQGLLGFSQGACFVGLICGLAKKKITSIKPDFAVLSSGFISGSLVHKSVYEEVFNTPSLHIFGLNDDIIPKELSIALAAHFDSKELMEHDGGHYFPATALQKQAYINFFQDQLQTHLEKLELQKSMNNFLEERFLEKDASTDASSD